MVQSFFSFVKFFPQMVRDKTQNSRTSNANIPGGLWFCEPLYIPDFQHYFNL